MHKTLSHLSAVAGCLLFIVIVIGNVVIVA